MHRQLHYVNILGLLLKHIHTYIHNILTTSLEAHTHTQMCIHTYIHTYRRLRNMNILTTTLDAMRMHATYPDMQVCLYMLMYVCVYVCEQYACMPLIQYMQVCLCMLMYVCVCVCM